MSSFMLVIAVCAPLAGGHPANPVLDANNEVHGHGAQCDSYKMTTELSSAEYGVVSAPATVIYRDGKAYDPDGNPITDLAPKPVNGQTSESTHALTEISCNLGTKTATEYLGYLTRSQGVSLDSFVGGRTIHTWCVKNPDTKAAT